MRNKAISHGVIALLLGIKSHQNTDENTKSFIDSQIISNLEMRDLKSELCVVSYAINVRPTEVADNNINSESTDYQSIHSVPKYESSMIRSITELGGNIYNQIKFGIMNSSISEWFELKSLAKLIECQISSLESLNQRRKEEEIERRRKLDEIKMLQDINRNNKPRRFHAQK